MLCHSEHLRRVPAVNPKGNRLFQFSSGCGLAEIFSKKIQTAWQLLLYSHNINLTKF